MHYSRSSLFFSQCSSCPQWPSSQVGTELEKHITISLQHKFLTAVTQRLIIELWSCDHRITNVHNTCFQKNSESLLQGYIKLFEVCSHCDFGLEACARLQTFHCILGFYFWRVYIEDVHNSFCACVVQAYGGQGLQPVKLPCQKGSSGCAVYIKGGRGHWDCWDTKRDEVLTLLNMIEIQHVVFGFWLHRHSRKWKVFVSSTASLLLALSVMLYPFWSSAILNNILQWWEHAELLKLFTYTCKDVTESENRVNFIKTNKT